MRNPAPSTASSDTGLLFQYWQAEAVRLRETLWGPLEDRLACQQALKAEPDLATRIITRAAWLAGHSGLGARLAQWATSARWALVALWVATGLAGMGAAATSLGQPQGAINLSLALLALLGLHSLTFTLWLASYLPGIPASTALSRLWLWITKRLAHGPDSALAAQAFVSLMARARAWRSLLGLISHGAWTLAFLGMLPTLVVLLSTRRYTFHWETTLLSPDAFIGFTHFLGAWPRLLGFAPPGAVEIAASVSPQPLAGSVQADWSWWLIGCVFAWGLLPRLAALLACVLHLRHCLRQPLIDTHLPGWLELRERLLPTHQHLGIDRAAPAETPARMGGHAPHAVQGEAAILAHELGADLNWPPEGLPPDVQDMGRCDSREDRARIRTLLDTPPAHLLLVCDARLTPDRGTRAWLEEMRDASPDLQVLCRKTAGAETIAPPNEGSDPRLQAWTTLLDALGIPQAASLEQWLTRIGVRSHG